MTRRPQLKDIGHGEVPLKSYQSLHAPGHFSEELLEKILRRVSAQKYMKTVINSAEALGLSPTSVSRKRVQRTA